jgi:probable rRNA maturation factor
MILNRQRRVPIPMEQLRDFMERAQKQLRLPGESLTVCFVSDAQIARWNRSYRGKRGPTDVLSFPADRGANTQKVQKNQKIPGKSASVRAGTPMVANYLGDIAISPAVARRNARRFGRSLEDEMRILILHGMLHLMGYDHEIDTGQMNRRERRVRRKLGLA